VGEAPEVYRPGVAPECEGVVPTPTVLDGVDIPNLAEPSWEVELAYRVEQHGMCSDGSTCLAEGAAAPHVGAVQDAGTNLHVLV
jgi:hypothetical protein